MPVQAKWKSFYDSDEWLNTRAKVLERAHNCCEYCGKRDRSILKVVRDRTGRWSHDGVIWFDTHGRPTIEPIGKTIYAIRVVLTVAHLDRNPPSVDIERLRALCQHCHLKYDYWAHRAQIRIMQEQCHQQINLFAPEDAQ